VLPILNGENLLIFDYGMINSKGADMIFWLLLQNLTKGEGILTDIKMIMKISGGCQTHEAYVATGY